MNRNIKAGLVTLAASESASEVKTREDILV